MSQQSIPQPLRQKRGAISFALAGLLVVLCAMSIASCSIGQSSCSVGINGSDATITIEGSGSSGACDNEIAGQGLCGKISASCYSYSDSPSNPEVCEGDFNGDHYIVRDSGLFKIVGNELCQALRSS